MEWFKNTLANVTEWIRPRLTFGNVGLVAPAIIALVGILLVRGCLIGAVN